jgi:hypothetical protein
VWLTSVPLAVIGAVLSVWHIVIERYPSLAGPCDPSNPCTIKWVEEFGFLTVPTMALVAGLADHRPYPRGTHRAGEADPSGRTDHDRSNDR